MSEGEVAVEVKEFGKHIVADPRICHGKWTFRGTRIMVWQVLEQIAEEEPWDVIVKEWGGRFRERRFQRPSSWHARPLSRQTMNGDTRRWSSLPSPDEPARRKLSRPAG